MAGLLHLHPRPRPATTTCRSGPTSPWAAPPTARAATTATPTSTTRPATTPASHGSGNNRFAIRLKGAAVGSVSVSGWQHMTIYANYSGANTDVQPGPRHPGRRDQDPARRLLRRRRRQQPRHDHRPAAHRLATCPPRSTTASPTGCVNGALPGCQFTNVSTASGWNGKVQYVRIPIPNTYTCNATQAGGCWFRLQVLVPGRRQRHHHLDGADHRRPHPPHQVAAGRQARPSVGRSRRG